MRVVVAALALVAGLAAATMPAAMVDPYAQYCCPNSSNLVFDTTGDGVITIRSANVSNVLPNTTKTFSLWVRLSTQQSGTPVLMSRSKYSWETGPYSGFELAYNARDGGLQLSAQVGNETLAPVFNASKVQLPVDRWRLVSLMVDTVKGEFAVYVDAALEILAPFPPLKASGMVDSDSRGLTLGGSSYATNVMVGRIGDFNVIRGRPVFDLWFLANFRQCPSEQHIAPHRHRVGVVAPGCLGLPPAVLDVYQVDTTSFRGYSAPGGSRIGGRARTETFLPVAYVGAGVIEKPRWTAKQAAEMKCGTQQEFRLKLPALASGSEGLIVEFNFSFPADAGVVTAELYMGTIMHPSTLISSNQTISENPFYTQVPAAMAGSTESFIFSVPSGLGCINSVASRQVAPVKLETEGAANNVLWSDINSSALLIDATSSVALVREPAVVEDCRRPETKLLPVIVEGTWQTGVTLVDVPGLTDGAYRVCTYFNSIKNTAVLSGTIPNFVKQDILVAPIPAEGAPLKNEWISSMLHLGGEYSSVIPNARISDDFFAESGGEAMMQPIVGQRFLIDGVNLTWTPMESADAMWGKEPMDKNQWVQYMSLALYTAQPQEIVFAFRHWYGARVWCGGERIFKHSSPDGGGVESATPFMAKAGWTQCIFKISKWTGQSFFQAKVVQGTGLAWAFEIPGATGGGNGTYSDKCAVANPAAERPCIAGPTGAPGNISETECYNVGCCYVNGTGQCFAPPGDLRKWRTDGRCGVGFTAPGAAVAQCIDGGVGATCCSEWGWCGNSVGHCYCESCIDYVFEKVPRCLYSTYRQATCWSREMTTFNVSRHDECRAACDELGNCTAYTLGQWDWRGTPCSLYFEQCNPGWNRATTLYRKFCGCEFVDECADGKPCECEDKTFTRAVGKIPQDSCQLTCSMNPDCAAFTWTDGECFFETQPCKRLQRPVGKTVSVYKTYTCPNYPKVPPTVPSNSTPAYSAHSTHLGCFNDLTGELLAQNPRDRQHRLVSPGMTADVCEQWCFDKGALFFALHNGNTCMCGVRQPKSLTLVDTKECIVPCAGNVTAGCGGVKATAMYVTTPPTDRCGRGGLRPARSRGYNFNGSCYQFLETMMSQPTAQVECEKLGGSLGSATNLAEAQFMLSLPSALNYTETKVHLSWIGGAVNNAGDRFGWTDGTAWGTSLWRTGEPTTPFGREGCVESFSNYPTPWKGAWNDLPCSALHSALCKMPEAGATRSSLFGALMAASNNGGVACSSLPLAQNWAIVGHQAWYPLSANLDDQSGLGRNARAVPTSTAAPAMTFVDMALPFPTKGLSFNGESNYYVETPDSVGPTSNTISMCAWIQFDDLSQRTQTVMAKLVPNATQSPFQVTPRAVFSLETRYATLCLTYQDAYNPLCYPVATKTPYFVCGSIVEANMELWVDGSRRGVRSLSWGLGYDVRPMDSPIVIGAMPANRFNATAVTDRLNGVVAYVGVYAVALSSAWIRRMFYCGSRDYRAPQLAVYASKTTTAIIYGQGFANQDSLRVTNTPCSARPTITRDPLRLYSTGVDYGSLALSADFLATVLSDGPFNLCMRGPEALAIPLETQDIGIQLTAVIVNTFADGTVVQPVTAFPMTVSIAGKGLATTQQLLVATDAFCATIIGRSFFTAANGTHATGVVQDPKDDEAPLLYLCWAGTEHNRGMVTPLSIEIPKEATIVDIAVNDGTVAYTPDMYTAGYTNGANYIKSCRSIDINSTAYVLQVKMGSFTDSWIPAGPNVDMCSMLTGAYYKRRYAWSNPLGTRYQGDARVIPSSPGDWLGGSPQYYPAAGREFLSSWGSRGGSKTGGCCADGYQQPVEWYRAFTLRAVSIPRTNVYMQLPFAPRTIYENVPFNIYAVLVDAWGVSITRPVTYVISCDNAPAPLDKPMTVNTRNGALSQSINFRDGLRRPKVIRTLACSVQVKEAKPTNGNTQPLTMVVSAPPSAATPMTSGFPISMLKLGGPAAGIPFGPYTAQQSFEMDYLVMSGGEAEVRPKSGDIADILGGGSRTPPQWTPVFQDRSRYYGSQIPVDSTSYYAFAFYTPQANDVRYSVNAPNLDVRVYVDGEPVMNTQNEQNRSVIYGQYRYVSGGWHQVVIKATTTVASFAPGRTPQFQFAVQGVGLMSRVQLPAAMPEDASQLQPKVPIARLLHLGESDDSLAGDMATDLLAESEALAQPKLGRRESGLMWQSVLNFNGTWTLTAGARRVSYYAMAVYCAADGPFQLKVTYNGPLYMWLNGKIQIKNDFTWSSMSDYVGMQLTQGWHQLLFKQGSLERPNVFSLVPQTAGFGYATAIPLTLAPGAAPMSGLLDSMLHLESVPQGYPGIPSLNGSVPHLWISSTPNVNEQVSVRYGGRSLRYSWFPKTRSSQNWGDHAFGGEFNSYYAVSIYTAINQTIDPFIMAHGKINVKVDGNVVLDTDMTTSFAPATPQIKVAKGWHNFVFTLTAPNDFELVPINATTTYAEAAATCHTKRRHMCPTEAYCPIGQPRLDGLTPAGAGTIYAPASDKDNLWINIGNSATQCQTVTSAATRGQFVGCCNGPKKPTLIVDFFDKALGWAYETPAPPLVSPLITVENALTPAPLVVLTARSGLSTTIRFTTDGSTPTRTTGTQYTKPFTVYAAATITAVVFDSTRSSPAAVKIITPQRTPSVVRTGVISGVRTEVQLTGMVASGAVAFAPADSRLLALVAGSPTTARDLTPNGTYSGLMTLPADLVVSLQATSTLEPGRYQAVYFETPSDSFTDGVVLDEIITVGQIALAPSSVIVGEQQAVLFGPNVQDGDSVVFGPVGSRMSCAAYCGNPGLPGGVMVKNGFIERTFDSVGLIKCLCYRPTMVARAPTVIRPPVVVTYTPVAVSLAVMQGANANASANVTTIAPDNGGTKTAVTIGGSFTYFDTSAYAVRFIGGTGPAPTCLVMAVMATSLNCDLTVTPGTSGRWTVYVELDGSRARGPALPFLALPPSPAPTVVSSPCASDSSRCTTAALLTIAGVNFNDVTQANNRVQLTATSAGAPAVQCDVISATATQLVCRLGTITSRGTYSLSVVVVVDGPVTVAGDVAGQMRFGFAADVAGWSTRNLVASTVRGTSGHGAPQANGATLSIAGTFGDLNPGHFRVLLTGGRTLTTPTCPVISVTATTLQCVLSVQLGTSGAWTASVEWLEEAVPVAAPANMGLTLLPPTPVVTSIGGACAEKSSDCKQGTVVTFRGKNFDTYTQAANFVTLNPTEGSVLQCINPRATVAQLTCELHAPGATLKGKYNVQVGLQVTPTVQRTTTVDGILVAGYSGDIGWSGAPNVRPSPNGSPGVGSPDSLDTKTVVIVVVVVGAVLFAAVAAVGAVLIRRTGAQARSKPESPHDMDYVQMERSDAVN